MFIGIFGSRRWCADQAAAVVQHLLHDQGSRHTFVIPAEASATNVYSVAAVARRLIPAERAHVIGAVGPGIGGLVQRSAMACRTLAANHGTAYILPAVACPAMLRPSRTTSRCWGGHGIGSWAEAAYCVGLGVRVVLFTPPPSSWHGFALVRRITAAGFSAWLLSPRRLAAASFLS